MIPAVLDGGMGTQLESDGVVINQDPLWSTRLLLDDNEALVKAHSKFAAAGAQILTTASYQFSYEAFMGRGMTKQAASALLTKSVALARQAFRETNTDPKLEGLVAGSLGTYAAVLADGSEYTGKLGKTHQELVNFHTGRLEGMLSDREMVPDYLAMETIPCLDEVRAICEAVSAVFEKHRANAKEKQCVAASDATANHDVDEEGEENKPKQTLRFPKVWLTVSCRSCTELNSGEGVVDAVQLVAACPEISLFGFNCVSPSDVSGLIEIAMPHLKELQLIVYPNRGEVFEDREWKSGTATSDGEFIALVDEWLEKAQGKLAIIGGCCRIEHQAISRLAKHIKSKASN